MSARFSRELEEARQSLPEGSVERQRVTAALGTVQSTFIGTIHGFCSRLLRERPLDAGLPPDFTAGLSDREERRLRDRAWNEHLRDLYDGDGGELEDLAACGIEPRDLSSFFHRLCRFPDLDLFTDGPSEPPDMAAAIDATIERMRDWSTYRPDAPAKGPDPVMGAFDKAERMLRYLDLETPAEQADFLSVFASVSDTERAKVKTTYWKGDGVNHSSWAKSLRDDLLPDLIETTILPVLREWEAYVHRVAVACTAPAVERFRDLRRREGLLTFHDLLSLTRDMLRDRPRVRRAVQERYPRLLVDEFQDTDPLQAEILSFLAARNPGETDWRACRPRDGSLFIVGDDKQSIYRFRRADKDVFEAFRQRLDAEPNGEAVDLTKNFRSRAPICRWCNDVFADLFSREEVADVQAEYVPFNPQRPAGPDGTALRRKPVDDVRGNFGSGIAEQDAEQIAAFIQAAMSGDADPDFYRNEEGAVFGGDVRYGDFLILTRVRSRLSSYTDALAQHGIPYTVTGSRDMSDTDELKAIVDLLRFALRPDDPLAATAYLKGLLVGASDADLYRFRQAGGDFRKLLQAEMTAMDLPEETAVRMDSGIQQVRRVREIVHSTRPGAGFENVIEETGLLAGAAHPKRPSEASRRAGAVMLLLHAVQGWSSQGLGWGDVVEELDLVLQGEEDMDGMTLETGSEDAVRIMNVHQAKGLEAPVVFLADPYTSGSAPAPEHHVRRAEGDVVVPVVRGEGIYSTITHAPRGWYEDTDASFITEEKRRDLAEEHRLLYVAATRAERLLVVSTYPKKAGEGYWGALYPHMTGEIAPELEFPDSAPDEASEAIAAPAPDLAASEETRQARLDAGRTETYVEDSVTGRESSGDEGAGDRPGYGRTLGIVLHDSLELLIRERHDPPTLTVSMLRHALLQEGIQREEGITDATIDRRVETLEGMIADFRESWIWKDVRGADVVRVEHRFIDVRAEDGGTDRLLRGAIDLLYRRDGAWTLVDFKSDRVGGDDVKASVRDRYRQQVLAYFEAWERLQEEPVRQSGLWFADADAFVSVSAATDTVGQAAPR
jgi:ATP-dependent helicase/nuclease subunit A